MSDSLQPYGLYSSWNSQGQNTGVDSLSLLRGSSQPRDRTQVSPHCRWILYQLSHNRSPRILQWLAYTFSSGSSQPRNGTGVSCIAGREAHCAFIQVQQSKQYPGGYMGPVSAAPVPVTTNPPQGPPAPSLSTCDSPAVTFLLKSY